MYFNQDRLETLRKALTDGCVTFLTFHSVCLFDLVLYVPSTIFQLNRDGLPGFNQY